MSASLRLAMPLGLEEDSIACLGCVEPSQGCANCRSSAPMEVGRGDSGEGRKPGRGCPYCPGCCCCGGGPPYAGLECPFAKPPVHTGDQLSQGSPFKKSRKSHGMLNAFSTMCFRGPTTVATHRGKILHLEASSWQIQAGQILEVAARVAQASQASAQAALAAERSQLLAEAVLSSLQHDDT